ncbi:MAG: zinc-ribbon domain-containing protein [Deltaproteobacteria bacterium]|nr:zinc-ribbon domain-containing protein [Deltaproteobacteria bacterium]
MVVTCPQCHSKFKLNKESFVKDKIKMRCSICSHIFTFQPEGEPSLEQEFDSLISTQEESLSESLEDRQFSEDFGIEITETPEEEEPEKKKTEQGSDFQPESVIREIDSILGAGEEIGLKKAGTARKTGGSRFPLAMVISVVIIIAIFAAIALWIVKDRIPFLQSTDKEFQQAVLDRGPFFSIKEESVTYEMLTNHQEGTVLVVKGVIKKLTTKPLESVMVQARIYDKDNKLIESRSAYAGIVPDSSELMRQKSNDINILLTAEPRSMGALASSSDIPFAVAFFGRPALDGASFQVEVKEFHWR